MAISVGSVEVDVIPNTQGIYARLQAALIPSATRVGDEAGRIIGRQMAGHITTAVRDGVNAGARAARPAAVRQGDETGGAFSRALKTRLEAAFRSLPKINIDANTSQADADLQALRVRMETLANKRIGIDIDAGLAKAEIKEIEAELRRLGASHPNVQVRADTATALAQLAEVRAAMAAVDGNRVRVDVDTSGALSAILQLGVAIAGLAAIPAIPVLAAGIGSIASAGVAAGAGVGALAAVAVPAFVGIAGALQAQKAAQDAATSSSIRGGQASGQGAAKALQMAGAQQALASAHRNAARQIGQAEQAVADAVRSSTEANLRAAQQVKAAKQALTDAVQQAAQRQRDATERVVQAEDSLADAQRSARQAQQDLTQARRDAAAELADLANRLTDAQLGERDAVLSVQEARNRLAAVQASGSKASLLDQQRAQLAYDQAVQRLKEQREETRRLSVEKKAADKAGVEGSDTVRTAQQRIADAERNVAKQQKDLAKARAGAAQQQIQNQRDIAEAQQQVAEASRNVSKVQEDGARSVARAQESLVAAQQSAADSIASAQRQIASASLSAAGGVDQAAIAQAKYQAALAKLTPSARGTFNAFVALKTAFKAWSESLQPAVMPLFTRALVGMKNALPGLTPFVLAAARAIKFLQDRVSAGFKSPWWKSFKKDLAGAVVPAIVGLGISFGRIFKGMAGIIQAFLPHMASISGTMQRITGRFSEWGTSLKGSPAFERFLAYASKQGPILARAIGDISSAFYQIAKASAPLSGPVLVALGAVARAIASIADTLPLLIQLFYAAWIATKLWTLAMIVFNLVMSANPVTLIIIGIIALVSAVIYAYKHFGWFRDIVQAVWGAIQKAAQWAWKNVLQPVFSGIWLALQTVGKWAKWLWENVLGPVFRFIWEAAKILFTIVVVAVLLPIIAVIKILGAIGKWLWDTALGPAFRLISAAALLLWRAVFSPVFTFIGDKIKSTWNTFIRPAFTALKLGVQDVGDKAKWLWERALRPTFNFIGEKGKWLWDKALKPAFDKIKQAVGLVADSFSKAKDSIKTAWDKVEGIAKKPVKFVIDHVYNSGIVPLWNKVADIVDAKKLTKLPLKGWATGGVLPGYTPGRDVHSFYSPTGGALALSGGEAVMRPEFTRAVGTGAINSLNAAARSGGVSGVRSAMGLKDGGVIDWLTGTASKVAGTAVDWAQTGLDLIANPTKVWSKLIKPILKSVAGGVGNSGFGKLVGQYPAKMANSLGGKITQSVENVGSLFGLGSGGGGGSGVKRWTGVVQQALRMLGQPAAYTDITLRRMNQESGGNPTIVNKWDSNWLAGHPSVGLMQVIGPTFRAYAGKLAKTGPFLYGTSVNPLANVYASMRYALAAYGSLPRAYNRAGGYDSGGYLQPGLNLAYNGTGRPEPVFTTTQANALVRLATAPASGDMTVEGTLVLDSGELMGTFRGVMNQRDQQLISAARAGRTGR